MAAIAERSKWPDERIDDLARDVRELRPIPERLATHAERMEGFREDVTAIGDLFRKLEGRLDQAVNDLREEQAEHRADERRDVRDERRKSQAHRIWTRIGDGMQAAALWIAVGISTVSLIFSLHL